MEIRDAIGIETNGKVLLKIVTSVSAKSSNAAVANSNRKITIELAKAPEPPSTDEVNIFPYSRNGAYIRKREEDKYD